MVVDTHYFDTEEGRAFLLQITNEWRERMFKGYKIPFDEKRAVEVVKKTLRLCEVQEPEIIICDSPFQSMVFANIYFFYQKTPTKYAPTDRILELAKNKGKMIPFIDILSSAFYTIFTRIFGKTQVAQHSNKQAIKNAAIAFSKSIYMNNVPDIPYKHRIDVRNQIFSQYPFDKIDVKNFSFSHCGSISDYTWASFYNAMDLAKLKSTDNSEWRIPLMSEIVEDLKTMYIYTIIQFDTHAFISRPPIKLTVDGNFQSSDNKEEAISFLDGYRIYSVRGVRFEEAEFKKFFPQNRSIRFQDVSKLTNAEKRGVIIGEYGIENLFDDFSSLVIDKIEQYAEPLKKSVPCWLIKVNASAPGDRRESELKFVILSNHTDGKLSSHCVPREMEKVKDAIQWMNHGISPDEFASQT